MDSGRLDLGLVSGLSAESFGEPGQRTFRLLAEVGEGRVSLWLEKEQVVMLGSALSQLMERVPAGFGWEPTPSDSREFSGELEVTLGSLAVGYNREVAGFTFEATDFVSPFELSAISLVATRGQLTQLAEQIDAILAGSRPRCRLCGAPLSGGPHFCPESNGHVQLREE